MSELPESWAWSTLENLSATTPRSMTDGPFGSNLKTAHYTDAGPRVIRLQNIGDGVFNDVEAHISPEHFASLTSHSVVAGDLVVASLGTDLPRACLVPASVPPAIVKADCIRVRLHSEIDAKYVNFALQRPELRRKTQDEIHGVGRPRIGMAGVKAFTVPVPPLPEQQRIVAAIEEHFSRLDAAEASVSSASDRSKMSLQAGLRRLLDSSGKRHRLAEVCSHIVDCEHSTAKFVPTGVPCVDTTNVEPFRLAPDRFRFVSETTYMERIRRIEPTEGDVIFTREGTIGSAAMVPPGLRLCLGQRVAILRPSISLDSQYLELALNSLLVRQQYRPLIQGTTAPHLNMRDIRALSIPVPSIPDQKATVVVAQELLSAHTVADMAIGQAKLRSAALRRSILAAAFSGRLVPQDPSDEPAAILLDRIAAERAASKPSRRKKTAS